MCLQMLDQLPNCVFDASGPLRQYTTQARAASFFTKAAELSAVGLLTGTLTSLLSQAVVGIRKKYDPSFEPSIPVPEVARSSAGLAAFFAISANTRYQLLGGMDRYLFGHSNYLLTYLGVTGAARVASHYVAEQHRAFCMGLPDPSTFPARRRVVRRKVVKKKLVSAQPAAPLEAAVVAPVAVAAAAASTSGAEEPVFLDQVLSAEPVMLASTSGAAPQEAVAVASSSSSAPLDIQDVAVPVVAGTVSVDPAQQSDAVSSSASSLSIQQEASRQLVGAGQR